MLLSECGLWFSQGEELEELYPLEREENYFSYYLSEGRNILCRADWCTLLYFETYAEVDGIEPTFCEPENFMFLRYQECRIQSDGGKIWAIFFEKNFFNENMKSLIADCPIFYDFICSEKEQAEILVYISREEGEKELAVEMLKSQLAQADQYRIKNVSIAFALFLTISHRTHYEENYISGSTMMTEYLEGQILRYLSENYATATLSSTAEAFHYHPNYFSSLFHRMFGSKFSEKLQQIRLERARYLLSTTDLSVEEVRIAVGFSEKSYFYRIFKKKYQIAPAEFRKKVRSFHK